MRRNGRRYFQRYERGKPVCGLKDLGYSDENIEECGTKVTFKPDSEIFGVYEFDTNILATRLRELAFLNRGLSLSLADERSGEEKTFKYEGGIASFLGYINRDKRVLHRPIIFEDEKEEVKVEIGVQYNDSYTENIFSFVNNVKTIEGGKHLSGFKAALTRAFNEYGRASNLLKKVSLVHHFLIKGRLCNLETKIPRS